MTNKNDHSEHYDDENDIYFLRIGDDDYEVSEEYSIVLDKNKEGDIIGIEIFYADGLYKLIHNSEKSQKNFLEIISRLLSDISIIKKKENNENEKGKTD